MNELKTSLEGQVPDKDFIESVNYYNRYIDGEINKGKSEEEVIGLLGRGSIIAKSIIEASKGSKETNKEFSQDKKESKTKAKQKEKKSQKGFNVNVNEKGKTEFKIGCFVLNSWYGILLLVLAAILLIGIVIAIVCGLAVILWKVLIPILALGLIIYLIVAIFSSIGKKK